MINRRWGKALFAVVASAWIADAAAQAISSETVFDKGATYSTDDPKRLRMLAIVEHRLENVDLDLTIKQKAAIQDALDAFVSEMTATNQKFSPARERVSSSDQVAAQKSVRGRLSAALAAILTDRQRSVWEADKTARSEVISRMKPIGKPTSGAAGNR